MSWSAGSVECWCRRPQSVTCPWRSRPSPPSPGPRIRYGLDEGGENEMRAFPSGQFPPANHSGIESQATRKSWQRTGMRRGENAMVKSELPFGQRTANTPSGRGTGCAATRCVTIATKRDAAAGTSRPLFALLTNENGFRVPRICRDVPRPCRQAHRRKGQASRRVDGRGLGQGRDREARLAAIEAEIARR